MISKVHMERIVDSEWLRVVMRVVLFPMVIAFQWVPLPAQTEPSDTSGFSLQLIARGYGDSIVLRWGPVDRSAWEEGRKHGYIVERFEVADTLLEEPQIETITPEPIHPWSQERWREEYAADTSRTSLMAASALLYDDYSSQIRHESRGSRLREAWLEGVAGRQQHGVVLLLADFDPLIATGMGLRFVDRNVEPGAGYIYRVYSALGGEDDRSEAPSSPFVYVQENGADRREIGSVESTVIPGDGSLEIVWRDVPYLGYSGYFVEREEKGRWVRMNRSPLVNIVSPPREAIPLDLSNDQESLESAASLLPRDDERWMSFVDSTIENYRTYRYRVVGIDPFADLSDGVVVEASGRDMTPTPTPAGLRGDEVGEGEVRLRWERVESSDLRGYRIYRGYSDEGPFRLLNDEPLPPATSTFLVDDADELEPYYYLEAVDTAGNGAKSNVVLGLAIDRIPPSPPSGMRGTVDSLGRISIVWRSNPESDILGYRLFFANDSTDEFSAVTGHPQSDTLYTDSLRIQKADRNIYYRVIALDRRQNQSQPSEILVVRQPDLTPPDAPAFRRVVSTDSSVVLRWGRGIALDVEHQVVMRRLRDGDGTWRELVRVGPEVESYEDLDAEPTTIYEYRLLAIDSSGLDSEPSAIVYAGAWDLSRPDGVTRFTASLDREEWNVSLQWSYTEEASRPLRRFVIYRGLLTGGLERYVTVDPGERTFVDERIDAAPVWRYAVRVETDKGQSELSAIELVELR